MHEFSLLLVNVRYPILKFLKSFYHHHNRDPFFALHKYTYLPRYVETGRLVSHGHLSAHANGAAGGEARPMKHDGVRYCPWCLDPGVKRRYSRSLPSL